MAELKFEALADLGKLKKQLNDFFKKKFTVNTNAQSGGGLGGSGGSGGKGGGGSKGLMGGIGKIVKFGGPLAIIAAAVAKILSVFPIVEISLSYMILGLFKIWDYIKALLDWGEGIGDKLRDWIEGLKESIGTFFSELPGKIWEFMKKIPEMLMTAFPLLNLIVQFVKGTWDWLSKIFSAFFNDPVGALKNALSFVWNAITALPKAIWGFMVGIWDALKEQFPVLQKVQDFISGVFEKLKTAVLKFFNDPVGTFKNALQFVWDAITALPGKIWEFMKQLPDLIGKAIKGAINIGRNIISSAKDFLGFGGGNSGGTANDAVIQNGRVIQLNPRDTVFATKNGSAGSGSTVNNFYGVTPKEIIEYLERQQGQRLRRTNRF